MGGRLSLLALLSFHAEPPELLYEAITAAGQAGATTIIAVPGPYALYPYDRVEPSDVEFDAIFSAVDEFSMHLTLLGASIYEGNEVGKRQAMIDVALESTTDDDWLLVIDADHLITKWPAGLPELLLGSGCDVACARFIEHHDDAGEPIEPAYRQPIYSLHRARRDLRMGKAHYTYEIDGASTSIIRGTSARCLDLYDDMTIEHRVHVRSYAKRAAQVAYYDARDRLQVER